MDDSSFIQMAMSEDRAKEDAALLVRFETAEIPDPEATAKNGYACFRTREIIRIRIPGTQEERTGRVTEQDKRRFPRAYAAFKAGNADVVDGTALKLCPILNTNEVSMFAHHGVASVEQVAGLSDEQLSGMGHGVRAIRDRVKSWYEARKSQQPVAELQARLKEKDEQLAALSQRLAALEAHKNGATAPEAPLPPTPKKRNRKPKAAQPEG